LPHGSAIWTTVFSTIAWAIALQLDIFSACSRALSLPFAVTAPGTRSRFARRFALSQQKLFLLAIGSGGITIKPHCNQPSDF
jgi:hypothetical protein